MCGNSEKKIAKRESKTQDIRNDSKLLSSKEKKRSWGCHNAALVNELSGGDTEAGVTKRKLACPKQLRKFVREDRTDAT